MTRKPFRNAPPNINRVVPRGLIADHCDLHVDLGPAPDGLPLVLHIQRQTFLDNRLRESLGALDELPETLQSLVGKLRSEVDRFELRRGLRRLDGRWGYQSERSCKTLFGRTLLARLLGNRSPLTESEEGSPPSIERASLSVALPMEASLETHRSYLSLGGLGGQLWVPLEGDGLKVVRTASIEEAEPPLPRPFELESLRELGARAVRTQGDKPVGNPVELSDRSRYVRTLDQPNGALQFQVPRQALGLAIARLSHELGGQHRDRRVHGDLKPDNVLLQAHRALAIDTLDLQTGQLSPAGTPGWAAPEQLMAQPVSPATDVFSLGLLVASLIGAVVYGEERSFLVPTGGTRCIRVRVLSRPEIFVDPTVPSALPLDVARHYQEVLRRALAFAPEDRWEDGTAFAAALQECLEAAKLPGSLSFGDSLGQLGRLVQLDGGVGPCWVVHDWREPGC